MAAEPIYNTVVDIVAGEIVSGRIQPGAVLSQQPPAGSRVDQSTLVKLTVAK